MYSSEEILERLKPIIDPEVGFSIVDMGLIYRAEQQEGGNVEIDMTLTTPMCPLGPTLGQQVIDTLTSDPEIENVHLNWVFNPPWNPREMASEEVKWGLGIFE